MLADNDLLSMQQARILAENAAAAQKGLAEYPQEKLDAAVEGIASAIFTGIGGCSEAEIQTFLPKEGRFETNCLKGMLELVSLNGNVVTDEQNEYFHHTHAVFSYKEGDLHRMAAGHIRSITVLYTAEIELRPVVGGVIKRKFDPETGTGFWDLG